MGKDFLKQTALFVFCLQAAFTMLHAQSIVIPAQFWWQESSYNPAASGLNNHVDGFVGYSWLNYAADIDVGETIGYTGLANAYISKINSGIGIGYNQSSTNEVRDYGNAIIDTFRHSISNFNVNYNYQIQLKNERVLALGVAVQKTVQSDYARHWLSWNPLEVNGTLTGVTIGAIYAAPRWHIGMSVSRLFVVDEDIETNPDLEELNFASEYSLSSHYTFDGGKNTLLTPFIVVSITSNNYGAFVPFGTLGLRLEHEWFLFGLDYSVIDYGYGNMSIGFKLWKQLSMMYTAGFVLADYLNQPMRHTFGLRYALVK